MHVNLNFVSGRFHAPKLLFQNGFVSALPYLVMWIVIVVTGQIVDMLLERQVLGRTVARKIVNSLGFAFPAVALVRETSLFMRQGGATR